MGTHYDTLIDIHTVNKYLEDPNWLIFDCRFNLSEPDAGRSAYLTGHIPGSYYVHLDEDLTGQIIPGITGRHPLPKPEDFVARLESWGLRNEMQVVIFDQGPGGIAARFWWMLRWINFSNVAVLDGGWSAWEANYSVDQLIPEKRNPEKLDWQLRSDRVVDVNFVDQIKHESEYLLIDSRDQSRYLGIEEPIDPVKGHIPGAVNKPFKENLQTDGYWKSRDALNARFTFPKSFHESKTIFYCGSGVTACHNILAYKHAGKGDALLYPGSWSHWITNERRSIETRMDT